MIPSCWVMILGFGPQYKPGCQDYVPFWSTLNLRGYYARATNTDSYLDNLRYGLKPTGQQSL